METEKRRPVGISFDPRLLVATDSHILTTGEDRSEYVMRLISADLSSHGKLPGTKSAEIADRIRSLEAAIGEDRVLALLREAAVEVLAS